MKKIMFTKDQLDKLDAALKNLNLPHLTTSKANLIAIRSPTFNDKLTISLIESQNLAPIANVTLDGSDWVLLGKYLRYDNKTIIASTELIDIVVEKILGISCGWRTP